LEFRSHRRNKQERKTMQMHRKIFTRAEPAELLLREATFGARSWNEAERTFEVTFAAGADVERMDPRGAYRERLDLNQDWTSFRGAPVLNSHKRSDVGDILGSVTSAQTVGNEARATIRMSKRPEAEAVVQDILAGHVRAVSVGYVVDSWKDSTESGKRVRTAAKWTPKELSIVAVAADSGAHIRGSHMDIQTTGGATLTDRAAINAEIRSIAKTAGLPQSWVDSQIDAPSPSVEVSRAAAFVALQLRSAAANSIRVATASIGGHDATDPEWRARTIGEAIYCRMSGTAPSEAARPFAGLSLVEIARDTLRLRGLSTSGSPATIMERALLSTSDLPAIMADSVNRTMRQAYTAAPSGLKRVARATTARDFRTKHRIQMTSAPTLLPVNEAGEFHSGAIADQEETYKIGTFGRIIGFTRQAYVNDDLGALNDITRRMGVAAAQFENQFITDLFTTSANMSDAHPPFHASHGNLAGTGAVISEATLTAGRLAMRQQTEPGGQLIDATPKFLIVPSALETLAEKTITAIQARAVADVNVFAFLSLVVEPRLSGTAWYLASDPASIEGLEYAYLEGEQGPQTFSEVGFDIDGLRFKIRLDFGGGWVDFRGFYRNPGA
jgi:HK97 family phage prohead protease